MAKEMIRIRLKAYDHQVIDQSAEKIVETATIPVQSHAIAIKIPPPEAGFGLFYARTEGKYALRAEQPKFLSDFLKKIQKDA